MGCIGITPQDYLMKFDMLEQHYRDNYRRYVKRMTFRAGTEWDAEDVVHDAYERALRYYNSFDGGNIDRWFNTILTNALKDFKANEKGFATSEFDEEESEGTPCEHYPSRLTVEIYDLINTKSLVQIEVLTLWMKEQYSARDISQLTSNTYGSCKSIIKRFKDELKSLYN